MHEFQYRYKKNNTLSIIIFILKSNSLKWYQATKNYLPKLKIYE